MRCITLTPWRIPIEASSSLRVETKVFNICHLADAETRHLDLVHAMHKAWNRCSARDRVYYQTSKSDMFEITKISAESKRRLEVQAPAGFALSLSSSYRLKPPNPLHTSYNADYLPLPKSRSLLPDMQPLSMSLVIHSIANASTIKRDHDLSDPTPRPRAFLPFQATSRSARIARTVAPRRGRAKAGLQSRRRRSSLIRKIGLERVVVLEESLVVVVEDAIVDDLSIDEGVIRSAGVKINHRIKRKVAGWVVTWVGRGEPVFKERNICRRGKRSCE